MHAAGLPTAGPLIFTLLMVAVIWLGLALSARLDPALWIRRRSGPGWTLNL
ncbi:MAG TPA: hypothetical protein VKV26_20815 [Dehalococcoidia bacterium]|nr:hypothetical protein [Dehalococcoidia bacterium]